MGIAVYLLAFGLLTLGLYTIVAKKNVVKIIVGVLIIEYTVNLMLVLVVYRFGGTAPIRTEGEQTHAFVTRVVDPLPQAMVLTSIVIGLGLVALMVTIAIRLYEKYGTYDTNRIRKLRG